MVTKSELTGSKLLEVHGLRKKMAPYSMFVSRQGI